MTIYVNNKSGEKYRLIGAAIDCTEKRSGVPMMVYCKVDEPQKLFVCAYHEFLNKFTETPQYTTGHCRNHRLPGGCKLHNLQCGYPQCDRRPVEPKKGEVVVSVWAEGGKPVLGNQMPRDAEGYDTFADDRNFIHDLIER